MKTRIERNQLAEVAIAALKKFPMHLESLPPSEPLGTAIATSDPMIRFLNSSTPYQWATSEGSIHLAGDDVVVIEEGDYEAEENAVLICKDWDEDIPEEWDVAQIVWLQPLLKYLDKRLYDGSNITAGELLEAINNGIAQVNPAFQRWNSNNDVRLIKGCIDNESWLCDRQAIT